MRSTNKNKNKCNSDVRDPYAERSLQLIDYLFSKPEEIERAIREYTNIGVNSNREIRFFDENDEDLLADWSVFNFRMQNGRSVLENFIKENPKKLSKKELAAFEEMQYNKYGLYEVGKIKIDEWVELTSVQSGKTYRVIEKLGTRNSRPNSLLLCRVGMADGQWRMFGSNPLEIPKSQEQNMISLFKTSTEPITPKEIREIIFRT